MEKGIKKLTKDERYTAYCILLQEAEERVEARLYNHGICNIVGVCMQNKNEFRSPAFIDTYLHELSKAFDKLDCFWIFSTIFPDTSDGWFARINILKQCITETQNF